MDARRRTSARGVSRASETIRNKAPADQVGGGLAWCPR